MFADYVKMGVKAALIITATAIIVAVFSNIQFPSVDTSSLVQAVGMGKAFVTYWAPILMQFVDFFLALLLVDIALIGAYIALIAIRWVLKVNE